MNISVIVDKSTFQSLSFSELYRLSCYFKHVITPVLTMEILGDLKKEFVEGGAPSEARVKDFANKLFPTETVVNAHYKHLVKNELLGGVVAMDGRPSVKMQKAVVSSSGQKGFIVEETAEEQAIYKWKEGKFTEADKELSALWRMTTTNESVLTVLKDSLKSKLPNNIKNFDELNNIVNEYLANPDLQHGFLLTVMQNYSIDHASGLQILYRWLRAGKPLISEFAPYTFHCLRVDALFLFGLAGNLISTRPTNRVDLEYLYYQPFSNVFTSNDKVHKGLAPLLVRPYQKFIVGSELKEGLKLLVDYLANLPLDEVRKFKNEPPIVENSLVFQLWKEFFGYPEKSNMERNLSNKELEMMKRKMDEFAEAFDNDSIDHLTSENAEFVAQKSYLSKQDVCYCGSGKIIINCCIPEEKFDEIVRTQASKRADKA